MGMFDELRCRMPLPAPNCEGLTFQTKDYECNLVQLTIREGGELWGHAHEDDEENATRRYDFTGSMNFYTSEPSGWIEFKVLIFEGRVCSPFLVIKDSRS